MMTLKQAMLKSATDDLKENVADFQHPEKETKR